MNTLRNEFQSKKMSDPLIEGILNDDTKPKPGLAHAVAEGVKDYVFPTSSDADDTEGIEEK